VVQALLRLIRLRNDHPAFNGRFQLGESNAGTLVLAWDDGHAQITLQADLAARSASIRTTGTAGDSVWQLAGVALATVHG
jgi:sucrose phosphorylase